MTTSRKTLQRALLVAGALALFSGPIEASREAPIDVVGIYLKALHARDPKTAYRYISTRDRKVRDETTYLRSQENFTGFALDFAKRLAADMDMWIIEQKTHAATAHFVVGYRLPTGDEISSQLYDWNPDKLNALSASEQAVVIAAWDKVKRRGKAVVIEGRETINLMREADGWKIFLDWQERHRVVFRASPSPPPELAVKFLRNDFLVKSEEPFQIDFQLANMSDRGIVVRLNHLFQPRRLERNVDMIACGSLLPLRLRPRETQTISSVYLLRGPLPAKSRLEIVYDFRQLNGTPPKR